MIVSYLTDNWNSRHYCCHVSSLSQYSLVIYKIDVFGDENVDRIMVRRQLSDLDQSNLSRVGSAGTRERHQRWVTPRLTECKVELREIEILIERSSPG